MKGLLLTKKNLDRADMERGACEKTIIQTEGGSTSLWTSTYRNLVSLDWLCSDAWSDWWCGVETSKRVGLDALAISSANKDRGFGYAPTSRRRFRALLKALELPYNSLGFVDYGCGKGRVLMEAADAGFKRVVGVEFSPELCDIARVELGAFQKVAAQPSRY